MAFLNPVAFLCSHHHSARLCRNSTRAVVQAVGRALASATSDPPPSKPSGPVRYVQKSLPHKEPDGSKRSAIETRNTKGWGFTQPGLDEENDRESNRAEKRASPKAYKGRGNKRSSDSTPSAVFPAVEETLTSRPHCRSNEDEPEESGQNITRPQLDAGEYTFCETSVLKTAIEDVQVDQLIRPSSDKDPGATARSYALGVLARGFQTEQSLRSKMTRKNFLPEVIDETITYVQKWGLQSDQEYAEVFARSRWNDNTWGPKRIKYELQRRGICEKLVETALVKVFQTSDTVADEEEEDLAKWGITTVAAEHLIAQTRRRWFQGDVKIDVKRRRIIGWLQRRGFKWTVISDVLKIMESVEET